MNRIELARDPRRTFRLSKTSGSIPRKRSDRNGVDLKPTHLILRSRAEHGVSKDDADTISSVAVLRDARSSALLRTRHAI
jgi:hypothetical protein